MPKNLLFTVVLILKPAQKGQVNVKMKADFSIKRNMAQHSGQGFSRAGCVTERQESLAFFVCAEVAGGTGRFRGIKPLRGFIPRSPRRENVVSAHRADGGKCLFGFQSAFAYLRRGRQLKAQRDSAPALKKV